MRRGINENNNVNGIKISPKRFYRGIANNEVSKKLNSINRFTETRTYVKMQGFTNRHVYLINEYGIRISVDFRPTSHKIFSLCLDEMFMFDFDFKDFGYNGTNKKKVIDDIYQILLQYVIYVDDKSNIRLAFKLYETDRGIHAYCITHRSGVGFPLSKLKGLSKKFIKNSVISVGSNISHFAYSRLRGACIRLVPKLKRKLPTNKGTPYNSLNDIHNLSSKYINTNFVSKPLLDENKREVVVSLGNSIVDPYLINLLKFKDTLISHLSGLYKKYGNSTNGVALGVLVKSNDRLFEKVSDDVKKIYYNFMNRKLLKNVRKPKNWVPKRTIMKTLHINLTKNVHYNSVFLKSEMNQIRNKQTGRTVGFNIKNVYNLNQLLNYYASSQKRFEGWNNIMYLPENVFKDNIIAQAIKVLNKLSKIYSSTKLKRIEFLLLNVKYMKNVHKILCHVSKQNKLVELRNSCAASVLALNEFLKSKNNSEIRGLLIKLDKLADVCTEGTCESIQQFINEEKGGFNFVYNSKISKFANINTAAIAVVKNMCSTSSNLAEFKAKFENIVTVLRDKLMDKTASNGKIDYMDIENYVTSYAAGLPAAYCMKYNNNSVYKVLTINGLINLNV